MHSMRNMIWSVVLGVFWTLVIANLVPIDNTHAFDVSTRVAGADYVTTPESAIPAVPSEPNTIGLAQRQSFKASAGVDKNKPKVKILEPKKNTRVLENTTVMRGTASDNLAIESVWWRVNGASWQQATGTNQWTATVPLKPGPNKVEVYSRDTAGNVSKAASMSLFSLKDLLITYWPMNDGDQKIYSGILGDTTITFFDYGFQAFEMYLDNVDGEGAAASMYYELNAGSTQLLLTGLYIDLFLNYWFQFVPPLIELDATLLIKGGTKKSSCMVTNYNLQAKFDMTVSVRDAGTVTVPAGTYQNCKLLTETIKARDPQFGSGSITVSAENYVLARGVGAIKIGVFEARGKGVSLVGYQDLVSGIVNGVPVGDFAGDTVGNSGVRMANSPSRFINRDETPMPTLDVETPHAILEFTKYDDGQNRIVIRGRSGYEFVIEAGSGDESGGWSWTQLWAGRLVGGCLSLSVQSPGVDMVYRVRER